MHWTRRDWIALAGVTLLGAILRLYQLGVAPPGFQFDEAFNAIDADLVLAGNRPLFLPANGGREVLYTYWQALIGAALGVNVYSLRLASALLGILAVALTYVVLRRMIRQHSFAVALFTSLVFAVLLWPIHFSHYAIRISLMPLLFLLTFGFFWLGGHAETRRAGLVAYAMAGFFLGLTPWSNPTGRLAPLVLLLYALWLLWRKPEQRGAWKDLLTGLAITGGVAFLVFLPLGIEFIRHPDWFFGHASEVSVFAERVSGEQPWQALLRNVLRVLGMFSFTGDSDATHGPTQRPVFDPLLSIPFYIGLALWFWRLRRADDPDFDALSLLLIWTLVMLLPSVLSERAPNYSRTLPALPALLTAAGLGLTWIASRRWGQGRAGPLLAALLVAGGALWTIYDYFVVFAHDPDIYYVYDADKLDALDYLHELTDDNQVYLSQLWGDAHATVYFLRGQYDIGSVETSSVLVLPPPGKGLVYAFPAEQDERAEQIASLWPDATLERVNDGNERPLLSVTTVPATDAAGWPARFTPAMETEARFTEGPTLLGMSPEEDGRFALYWRGDEVMLRDLTAFVHLMDADGRRVGQVDKRPGDGSYATPVWHVGERVIDLYTPDITDLCAGGESVMVTVGWYQLLADGLRMTRADAPGDTAAAGELTLPLRSYPVERFAMETPLAAGLDDLTLLGYTLRAETVAPGAPLTLDLLWQGNGSSPVTVTLEQDGAAFVLGEITPAANADWREGEALCRRLRLTVPPEVAPGPATLIVAAKGEQVVLEAVEVGGVKDKK
ncbi:MAG: phospholipid carrier-dependent glycosyltransferase [Caldilineaceae bacterium]|nr:phospholipid carrier-dependent glycosyltransferase [Caldilineaceae bacterium]